MELKTDSQNIKDSLLKREECILYKEEAGQQYVIRITPFHAPIPESKHSIIRNEDNCYFQLRQWVINELKEQNEYTTHANIQLRNGDIYYFIGIDIEIVRLNPSSIQELEFTGFADGYTERNMNYLKPFSVF